MIIGFVGFKQVGKSTASLHLVENYNFHRLNFKDGLVREMKQRFPDLLEEIAKMHLCTIDGLFEEKPPLMRALMQNFGTDVMRDIDPLYWVKQWIKALPENKNIVVDDVRFLNEAECVQSRGGIIIRLERDDIINGGSHESETQNLKIKHDHVIKVAKGDHEGLYRELDKIISQHD